MFYSIVTPAFNAANTIERVYRSLQNQTFTDFEWIVIDDGSTDQTSALIEDYKMQSTFPITLIKIHNQHKKVAIRYGLEHAKGLMTLIADADDRIPEKSLQIMYDCWQKIPDKNSYNGICGLCVDQEGKLIGNRFPISPLDCNAIEMRLIHNVRGEKWGCVLTKDLFSSYPDFDSVAGHVPEGIYQRKLSDKKARFVNEVLRVYYTNVDGSITNSGFNPINAQGILLDAIDWLDNYQKYFKIAPLHFIKRAAAYNKYLKYLTAAQRSAVKPQTGFARLLILLTVCARFL